MKIDFTLEKITKIALVIFILAALTFVLYFVKGALFPFAIGIVLTYVLHPLVISLERILIN